MRLLIGLLVSLIRSFVGLLVYSFLGLLVYSFVGLLVYSFVGLLVCWFVRLFVCSLIHFVLFQLNRYLALPWLIWQIFFLLYGFGVSIFFLAIWIGVSYS